MQQGSMASSVNRKITSAVCGHLIAMKDVLVVLQLPENTLPLQKDKLPHTLTIPAPLSACQAAKSEMRLSSGFSMNIGS